VTPNAVKDILYTGETPSTPQMCSDVRLKQLITKGIWRYSFCSVGQYMKVDLEPPNHLSTNRPIVLRVVQINHDYPVDTTEVSPNQLSFLFNDHFTKIDIHLSYQSVTSH